jgi:hypothetical protein
MECITHLIIEHNGIAPIKIITAECKVLYIPHILHYLIQCYYIYYTHVNCKCHFTVNSTMVSTNEWS